MRAIIYLIGDRNATNGIDISSYNTSNTARPARIRN
jgi:hypothetical protein